MTKQLTVELIWTIEDSMITGISMEEAEKIIDKGELIPILEMYGQAEQMKIKSPAKQAEEALKKAKEKLAGVAEIMEAKTDFDKWQADKPKIPICFDFDGVIHSFKSGWIDYDVIPDEPVQQIRQLLNDMKSSRRFVILIHSSRCGYEGGVEAIEKYMKEHSLSYDKVCKHKPNAKLYVDDLGFRFKNVKDFYNFLRDVKWM